MEKEIWKPITGFEGHYEISNFGRVKSLARRVNCSNNFKSFFTIWRRERIMRPTLKGTNGYLQVMLSRDGVDRLDFSVHRLVAIAFLSNPTQLREVNHLDGCKTNNHVSNLEWTTRAGNARHAAKHGYLARGERQGLAKLTESKVRALRAEAAAGGITQTALAARYGIDRRTLMHCVQRRTWKHV